MVDAAWWTGKSPGTIDRASRPTHQHLTATVTATYSEQRWTLADDGELKYANSAAFMDNDGRPETSVHIFRKQQAIILISRAKSSAIQTVTD
jgi:hypothetical protein